MSSEHVEVLRNLSEVCRAAIKAGDWKVDGACDPDAVLRRADSAIAALSAPQPPAEAQPVVWQDDWMSVADLDAHLGTLAEQYEWGGDEAVTINDRERLLLIDFSHGIMADEMFVAMMKAHHDPNARGRPDIAPPSAPVGVAADILRIVDTAIDVCNDRDRPAMAEYHPSYGSEFDDDLDDEEDEG